MQGVYVLDFVSNASSDQIYEKMETFYRILRDKASTHSDYIY